METNHDHSQAVKHWAPQQVCTKALTTGLVDFIRKTLHLIHSAEPFTTCSLKFSFSARGGDLTSGAITISGTQLFSWKHCLTCAADPSEQSRPTQVKSWGGC